MTASEAIEIVNQMSPRDRHNVLNSIWRSLPREQRDLVQPLIERFRAVGKQSVITLMWSILALAE